MFNYTYDADGELTAVSDNNSSYAVHLQRRRRGDQPGRRGDDGPALGDADLRLRRRRQPHQHDRQPGRRGQLHLRPRNELIERDALGHGDLGRGGDVHLRQPAGNMTGLTRYSNLAETTVVAATSYTYDAANQMTGITDKNSGGTTLVSYGYTYDAAGRVTQEARTWDSGSSTDTLTYGYTNNNQLTSVTHTNGVVRQRELQLGRQRQPDGDGLHDEHGQRADGLAGLHVHLRRRRQHDHGHADVDRRRVDLHLRLPQPDDRRRGEDVGRDGAGAGDVHVRRPGQPDRHGREWDADLDALRRRRRRSWTSTGRAPWQCGI